MKGKQRRQRLVIPPSAGRRREAMAIIEERPDKSAEIVCPYCFPRHPLFVGQTARCGTTLELKAVQRMYVGVACSKCGKTNNTLVKKGDHYEHSQECSPGKVLLTEDPMPSRSARIALYLPRAVRMAWQRRRGQIATGLRNNEGKLVYTWLRA